MLGTSRSLVESTIGLFSRPRVSVLPSICLSVCSLALLLLFAYRIFLTPPFGGAVVRLRPITSASEPPFFISAFLRIQLLGSRLT
jgi:hypothetical protein